MNGSREDAKTRRRMDESVSHLQQSEILGCFLIAEIATASLTAFFASSRLRANKFPGVYGRH
jgi:hypothetical protein